jgi:hypothetical protein
LSIFALAFNTPRISSLVKISVVLIYPATRFGSSIGCVSPLISLSSFSISIFFLSSSKSGTNSFSSSSLESSLSSELESITVSNFSCSLRAETKTWLTPFSLK